MDKANTPRYLGRNQVINRHFGGALYANSSARYGQGVDLAKVTGSRKVKDGIYVITKVEGRAPHDVDYYGYRYHDQAAEVFSG